MDSEEDDSDFVPGKKSDGDDDDEFDRTIYTDKGEEDFEEGRSYEEGEDEEMNTVTSKMNWISLKRGERTKHFNLDEKYTWISYDYYHNNQWYCCEDILILAIGRDKYIPRVARRDRKVIVGLVKPKFCLLRNTYDS